MPLPGGKAVSEIRRGLDAISYSIKWAKGVRYVAFAALSGDYMITFVPDATAPSVAGVTPANGETGVKLRTAVRVTFSEAMDPESINGGTIILSNATAGGLVSGR